MLRTNEAPAIVIVERALPLRRTLERIRWRISARRYTGADFEIKKENADKTSCWAVPAGPGGWVVDAGQDAKRCGRYAWVTEGGTEAAKSTCEIPKVATKGPTEGATRGGQEAAESKREIREGTREGATEAAEGSGTYGQTHIVAGWRIGLRRRRMRRASCAQSFYWASGGLAAALALR